MNKIVLNPVTRISGLMQIEATLENNTVTQARTDGMMFRGFELMLKGRPPLDAVYFTERICGICSSAHATASSTALEHALGVEIKEQGRFLRDITHACDFLQNHIRHFYQFVVPDYVKLPNVSPFLEGSGRDLRLPESKNQQIAQHYFDSFAVSRLTHTMLAVMGGKAPHAHGIFVGGVTTTATVNMIIQLKSMVKQVMDFIESSMLPDTYTIAQYYNDYYDIGKGYDALMTYGCFNDYKSLGTLYVNPKTYLQGQIRPLDPEGITEATEYAWYGDPEVYMPIEVIVQPDTKKEGAYSWIKAPRYFGLPYEVGPLARLWLAGEYDNGISTMDRIVARTLETRKIASIINTLLDHVIPGIVIQGTYVVPETAQGSGLVDTTRGALGHWMKIESGLLSFYQIITPSAWNFSSQINTTPGPAEHALLNTYVPDMNNPIELGRVVRSFDPCMSCATHVHIPGKESRVWTVVP